MPQSFASLIFHLIYSTKHRERLISDDMQSRLFEFSGGIPRNQKGRLLAAGGVEDHVHLLVSLSRQACIADTLRDLKANTSGWIHETFPSMSGFAWQAGYGAFSVSHSAIESVRQYIARQREHHRARTFQEEFREFLDRHEMPYDERYVWD